MTNNDTFTLINPKNGDLAFKLFSIDDNSHFNSIQRLNYYSMIWIKKGTGKMKVDFSEYDFCDYVMTSAYVGLVSGSAFGDPNCFRLSYAASEDQLREAVRRMKEVLGRLK